MASSQNTLALSTGRPFREFAVTRSQAATPARAKTAHPQPAVEGLGNEHALPVRLSSGPPFVPAFCGSPLPAPPPPFPATAAPPAAPPMASPVVASLPSYITGRKDGKHKSAATGIFKNPKIIHPAGSALGCSRCRIMHVACVMGNHHKCALCAAKGLSQDLCDGSEAAGQVTINVSSRPGAGHSSGVGVVPPTRPTKRLKAAVRVSSRELLEGEALVLTGLVRRPGSFGGAYTDSEVAAAIASLARSGDDSSPFIVLGRTLIEVRREVAALRAELAESSGEEYEEEDDDDEEEEKAHNGLAV